MNPAKVDRAKVRRLTDLPNVGEAAAADLRRLGITRPAQLAGGDPRALYDRLCVLTGARHDPCVLDVFISIVRFMDGEDPKPWWAYTDERKRTHAL
ncbi:MAG: helix-hairpin-helix domain-containing protein [Acidobacteria bacterium]|nr:helix-hairpin-helix domain-containing protein [Acidobacteriota bacterium]